MAEQCAVIGVGQTHHKKKRADVSIPGLLREAATRALADAECTWADIDAVVIGKAPDAFEGIVQPELFLAEALGGAGKPMLRVHTAGSVGGSTFIVGAHLIESRIHDRVLAIALSEPTVSEAHDITIFDHGDQHSVSLHLKLPADSSLATAHEVAERVEHAIGPDPHLGRILDVPLLELEGGAVEDVVADVLLVRQDLVDRSTGPGPSQIGRQPLRV